MKPVRTRIVFSLMALVSAVGARAEDEDDTVGNGGDPLTILFEDARHYAAERIAAVRECNFSVGVPPEIRRWVLAHQAELRDDVLASRHEWVTDPQMTCAFTRTDPRADITLSYEACRTGIRDIRDAVETLIHESTHHFAIADEEFARAVASAISLIGTDSECPVPPSQDPFDPASCPGRPLSARGLTELIPLPNANQIQLGQFTTYVRTRNCYAEHWCSAWANTTTDFFTWAPSTSINYLNVRGKVFAGLYHNVPEMRIYSGDWATSGINYRAWHVGARMRDFTLAPYHARTQGNQPLFLGTFRSDFPGERWYADVADSLSGYATRTCMRMTASTRLAARDNQGNDIMRENELVILSQYQPQP